MTLIRERQRLGSVVYLQQRMVLARQFPHHRMSFAFYKTLKKKRKRKEKRTKKGKEKPVTVKAKLVASATIVPH